MGIEYLDPNDPLSDPDIDPPVWDGETIPEDEECARAIEFIGEDFPPEYPFPECSDELVYGIGVHAIDQRDLFYRGILYLCETCKSTIEDYDEKYGFGWRIIPEKERKDRKEGT